MPRETTRSMMLNFLLLLRVTVIGVITSSNCTTLWKYFNLRAFISTDKLTRRQVRWALDLSPFDFWLVYRKGTLNPSDGPSRRPDYQRDAESEDSMTDNTSSLQRMLFPTVAAVTSQPMLPTEERARQILVIGTSNSRCSNQRRQASGVVSNDSIYEDVSKSLIDALPEFLRADPLAKKVTHRLATKESNLN